MLRKLKNTFHLHKAILANLIHGFPSRKMVVIGVTGTDGKTTTASLIYHILRRAGKKAALITTVAAYIGDKAFDTGFHVTTPSSFALQKYLKQAKQAGVEYLVLETTSHGLDQNRVWGINYQIGVLTNITHEHLDYHKTYEKYLQAKLKLLKKAKTVILNMDDKSFDRVKGLESKAKNILTYSLTNPRATLNLKKFPFTTKLLGNFNKLNSLAAAGVGKALGIEDKVIKKALSSFTPPPGRQEVVYNQDFKVIVDFAHTPNSLVEILSDLKKQKKGRLIHIFGAAGARDASKRPLMGKASAKFADIIILTAEDPRKEKVEEINQMIKRGIGKEFKLSTDRLQPSGKQLLEIEDRREAIEAAIKMAKKGDVVIITGKGHEQSMNFGKGEEPWDEKAVVKEALSSL